MNDPERLPLYPLTFTPILMERVWGGRSLERLFGKALPEGKLIGESWEISDRPGSVSTIANGPLAGTDLHWLMAHRADDLLGPSRGTWTHFPLLVKILDAQEVLSLQVHPPAAQAAELGGEPKTEMWYVYEAKPGATLQAGLKRGVTRELFEKALQEGKAGDCVHTHTVQKGDAMFLPSGRVHAIGAGNVIFEVQQNSDTTYRVFDWNRTGLDGRPRELHIPQSLRSINFEDYEPLLIRPEEVGQGAFKFRYLVDDPLFRINTTQIRRGERFYLRTTGAQIIGLLEGRLTISAEGQSIELKPGQFALLPASLTRTCFNATTRCEYLQVQF
ncbi:MAG: class I mannose-6-phosphate isomerase [Verrucomicrobiales bacterium]|nr:class I mannose-6-phosphate isomerase [Verrucomicrobiales bacterium]